MARPCNNKIIENDPQFTCFKPLWIPEDLIEKVEINADEFEAFRLSNLEWLSNMEWWKIMDTSASTFNRLLKVAQIKIADSLVNWKWIRIYKIDWTHNCK